MKEEKRRSGRPKKAENEKVKYQRIAVYLYDYERLVDKLHEQGDRKITEAFSEMVTNYVKSDNKEP